MSVVQANGRTIQYSDSGGSRPAVILAHGYFLDKEMFAAQESSLSPQWRIISWDARGHGGTADDGVPFTYWDSARDLLGLMDALDIQTATVGGVSQGGFISLRAALLAPDRIRGLTLFDTEAQACDADDKVAYSGLFAALSANGPIDQLIEPLARQLIGDHPIAAEWIMKWRSQRLPLGTPVGCLLERDDIVDRLHEISCPVLLARGSEDMSLPRERMDVLAERLPHSTSVMTIRGAAHSPPLTHAEEVNELLTRFLSGHIGDGRS
jgi:pimeloyl-ACP methyl ester carboxylesterase